MKYSSKDSFSKNGTPLHTLQGEEDNGSGIYPSPENLFSAATQRGAVVWV